MKKYTRFRVLALLFVISCFMNYASAAENPQPRASYTRRASEVVDIVVPEYEGTYNTYDEYTVSLEISSNITYNYNTGEIYSYSTPSCTVLSHFDDKTITASLGAMDCSISSDGYYLVIETYAVIHTVYEAAGLDYTVLHEENIEISDIFTVEISPQ